MTMDVRPEIPLQVITADIVRASIKRARKSLEKAAAEIVWQVEVEAWRTLGLPSWTAMREAEYGGAAVMLPSSVRPAVVVQLKSIPVGKTARGGDKHLTDQEIADTLGVDRTTVQSDLGTKNKTRDIPQNVDPDEDVIDAEIVEEEEPTYTTEYATAGTAPAEPATSHTCPTCHGTGKVTS